MVELGDSLHSVRIGAVGTPRGTMVANVFYRTSLDMPATKSHSPISSSAIHENDEDVEDESEDQESLPFCPFADMNLNRMNDISATLGTAENQDAPFASLLESAFPFTQTVSTDSSKNTPVFSRSRGNTSSLTPTPGLFASTKLQEISNDVVTSDSFVLIAPFASSSSDDVGTFYRECGSIPRLRIFSESSKGSGLVSPAQVEQEVKEIEDFINEMSLTDELT